MDINKAFDDITLNVFEEYHYQPEQKGKEEEKKEVKKEIHKGLSKKKKDKLKNKK
jgi:hypothetical protein